MKAESSFTCTPDVFEGLAEARERKRLLAKQAAAAACSVESLEVRRHLALTVSLVSGDMIVQGTSGGDVIKIYHDTVANPDIVYADSNVNGVRDGADVGFNVNQITGHVKVYGGAGDDDITIEGTDHMSLGDTPVVELAQVYGEGGLDGIWGGDYGDLIWGGSDNDNIRGWSGNDTVYGGYGGSDDLAGNAGDDLMYGGDNDAGGFDEIAPDTLTGGTGNDSLYGEGGAHRLIPEDGADFVAGGAGNDTFVVGQDFSVDVLDGESGTDSLLGTPDSNDNIISIP